MKNATILSVLLALSTACSDPGDSPGWTSTQPACPEERPIQVSGAYDVIPWGTSTLVAAQTAEGFRVCMYDADRRPVQNFGEEGSIALDCSASKPLIEPMGSCVAVTCSHVTPEGLECSGISVYDELGRCCSTLPCLYETAMVIPGAGASWKTFRASCATYQEPNLFVAGSLCEIKVEFDPRAGDYVKYGSQNAALMRFTLSADGSLSSKKFTLQPNDEPLRLSTGEKVDGISCIDDYSYTASIVDGVVHKIRISAEGIIEQGTTSSAWDLSEYALYDDPSTISLTRNGVPEPISQLKLILTEQALTIVLVPEKGDGLVLAGCERTLKVTMARRVQPSQVLSGSLQLGGVGYDDFTRTLAIGMSYDASSGGTESTVCTYSLSFVPTGSKPMKAAVIDLAVGKNQLTTLQEGGFLATAPLH